MAAQIPSNGLNIDKGLSFPATVSAQSGGNVLDDYEEGTWTPVIGNNGGSESMTLNSTYSGTDKAYYTKTGRLVTVTGYIVITGNGTHANSGTYINGLPFAINNTTSGYPALSVGYLENVNLQQYESIAGYGRVNNSNIVLWRFDTTGGGTSLERDELSSDGAFIFTMTYHTD